MALNLAPKPTVENCLSRIEDIMDSNYWHYYELFLPKRLDSIFVRLGEIDKMLVADEQSGLKELVKFVEALEAEKGRLGVLISDKEIKTIHAANKGMSDEEYRKLLMLTIGETSCKDIAHYEAQMVIHALTNNKTRNKNNK